MPEQETKGSLGLVILGALVFGGPWAYQAVTATAADKPMTVEEYDAHIREEIGQGISLQIRMCLDGRTDLLYDREAANHVCCNPKGLSPAECSRAIAFMQRQHTKNQALTSKHK